MYLAIIIGTMILGLSSDASRIPPQEPSTQNTAEPPPSQAKAPASALKPQASKPCPAAEQASSEKKPDCKPIRQKKTDRTTPAPSSGPGPTKTVVQHGGTAEPTIEISPGLSPQQALQKLHATNQLLAAADANMKQLAARQLSDSQQDTLAHIKIYMEQARTAVDNGEVQRAYNLANKANMLSADMVGH